MRKEGKIQKKAFAQRRGGHLNKRGGDKPNRRPHVNNNGGRANNTQ